MTLIALPQTRLAFAATFALLATGAALAESRTFSDLGTFTAIDASAGVTVEVSPLETRSVIAEVRNGDFDQLEITVEDGKLIITRDHNLLDFIIDGGLLGAFFGSDQDIVVRVTTPELQSADVSSGADMSVSGFSGTHLNASSSSGADFTLRDVSFDVLTLSTSSGAGLTATGTCDDLLASTSSGADLNAEGLTCETGELNASSGSDLTAHLSGSVSVNVSSGADITVHGTPEMTGLNQSSGGDIHLRD